MMVIMFRVCRACVLLAVAGRFLGPGARTFRRFWAASELGGALWPSGYFFGLTGLVESLATEFAGIPFTGLS